MAKLVRAMSCALVALATPAVAQVTHGAVEASSQEGEGVDATAVAEDGGDVIIVTATRRSEALSNVPLAVSAVRGDTLLNSGASDIRQLNQLSPSLLVSSSGSEAGAGSARIRGVGTVGDNAGLESSVATFIDGVYRSRSSVALTELGPIDRIEVLRGPQGTLFGRNASAGLLNIITKGPSFEEAGEAEVSIGNYDQRRALLGFTGPMGETIAYRLDGVYAKRDGFLRDVVSGRKLNNRDRWLVRGQLLLEPTDQLSVRLIGDYADRDEECCGGALREPTDPSAIALRDLVNSLGGQIQPGGVFTRRTAISPGRSYRSDVRDWGLSGQVDYRFGDATLTSITAYRDWHWVRGQDSDFEALDIFYRNDDGGSDQTFRTFTQELRLQGEAFDGKLDWLVGGYFANETLTLNDNLGLGAQYGLFQTCQIALQLASLTGAPPSPADPGCLNPAVAAGLGSGASPLGSLGPVVLAGLDRLGSLSSAAGRAPEDRFRQKSRNYALFTHNVINLTDRLSVTLGLRYTNERKRLAVDFNADPASAAACTAQAAAPRPVIADLPAGTPRTLLNTMVSLTCLLPPISGDFADSKTDDEFSGTAVLSFKPVDELLAYASYSRGYKAGGYNLDRQGLQLTDTGITRLRFEPETVNAFELGAKYHGRGFDLNVAAFYQLFDSFQLNTFNGLAFIVENIDGCSGLAGGSATDSDNDPATGACTGKSKAGVTSKGVEIEAFLRPLADLSLSAGFTYADTKYRDDLTGTDGRPLPNALFQLPGRALSNAPRYVVTGAASWMPAIGDGGLHALFYVDARYQSKINTGSDLDLEKVQPGFTLVNARLGLRGPDNEWAVEFWAQNLFDRDYIQVGFDGPLQGSGARRGVQQGFYPTASQLYGGFLGEPRTYGLTVRTSF